MASKVAGPGCSWIEENHDPFNIIEDWIEKNKKIIHNLPEFFHKIEKLIEIFLKKNKII